jgi:hypothetical protein
MLLSLLFSISIFTWVSFTWASIPDAEQVRDFYKSPLSSFRSGQAPLNLLNKKKSSAQTLKMNLVAIGKYQEWVPASHLYTIKDFQFTALSPMSSYTKTNAIIYKKINGKWTPFTRIKKGSAFLVEQMTAGWACGEYEGDYVCLANDQIIMAIDLAKKITTKEGKSFDFLERREDQLITKQNQKIYWKEILNWSADSNVALVRDIPMLTSQGNLTQFERVDIKESKMQYWIESIFGNHGKIWWKMQNAPTIVDDDTLILSTQEIKERGIFDWSTNKKSLAVISARGIFLSQEKDTWKFINRFSEVDHPVAIGPNRSIFVGDQYSSDGGVYFEPYIRWDLLSATIQEQLHRPPTFIKVTKIYFPNEKSKEVYFQIDTGLGIYSFATNISKQNLRLVE